MQRESIDNMPRGAQDVVYIVRFRSAEGLVNESYKSEEAARNRVKAIREANPQSVVEIRKAALMQSYAPKLDALEFAISR